MSRKILRQVPDSTGTISHVKPEELSGGPTRVLLSRASLDTSLEAFQESELKGPAHRAAPGNRSPKP